MGKRLTPEEREARIKAYEKAKAEKQAIREEKRKARLEAYEKAKEDRLAKREREKRGVAAANQVVSKKNNYVRSLPAFQGVLEKGDEVGFRFLGMAMAGKIVEYTNEEDYHDAALVEEGEESLTQSRRGRIEYYTIKENSEGVFYPIKKADILCKKVNGLWKTKIK